MTRATPKVAWMLRRGRAESARRSVSSMGVLLGLATMLLVMPQMGYGQSGTAPTTGVTVKDGRVTVRLSGASLAATLRDIARQTNLELVLLGRSDQAIAGVALDDLPLEAALRALMRGRGGGMLVFEEGQGGTRKLVGAYLTLEEGGPGIADDVRGAGREASAAGPPTGAAGPGQKDPATIAAAEERMRAGGISDFLGGAVALYPDARRPVDALYSAATHPDANIRMNALGLIAEVGDPQRGREVLEQATNDPDPSVQALAKQILGKPGAQPDALGPRGEAGK